MIAKQEDVHTEFRSQPRNKQIADIFKDMGEIEKYGSGIRRVVQAFLEEGHPAPKWQQISGGIMVTVYLDKENVNKDTPNGGMATDDRLTVGKTVGKTQETILNLIIDNPKITKPEMARLTGLSLRGVEWNIQQLKSSGLITRIGPNKGGHWVVNIKQKQKSQI